MDTPSPFLTIFSVCMCVCVWGGGAGARGREMFR